MADELKYPDFPRRFDREGFTLHSGYDLKVTDFLKSLQDALERVPEMYRANAEVFGPDEDHDEWGVTWAQPESDESYTQRWTAQLERMRERQEADERRRDNILNRWKVVSDELDAATTRADKLRLSNRLELVRYDAIKYNVELPE